MSEYKGNAIIGFFDLLGFSAEIERTWGQPNGALERLLEFKEKLANTKPTIALSERENPRDILPQVSTVSDSIVLKFPVPDDIQYMQVITLMANASMRVNMVEEFALEAGFALRGALEFGPVFWNESELIGPAFNRTYILEAKVAGESRTVLGPMLIEFLAKFDINGVQYRVGQMLYLSSDGLLCLDSFPPTQRIIEIEAAAPEPLKGKYVERLEILSGKTFPRPHRPKHWIKGRDEAEKRLQSHYRY